MPNTEEDPIIQETQRGLQNCLIVLFSIGKTIYRRLNKF